MEYSFYSYFSYFTWIWHFVGRWPNFSLSTKTDDRNFIIRQQLFLNSYWCVVAMTLVLLYISHVHSCGSFNCSIKLYYISYIIYLSPAEEVSGKIAIYTRRRIRKQMSLKLSAVRKENDPELSNGRVFMCILLRPIDIGPVRRSTEFPAAFPKHITCSIAVTWLIWLQRQFVIGPFLIISASLEQNILTLS